MESPSAADFEALFDHYLAHGCPCRFPRFRATVARDMKEVGAAGWDLSDIRELLEVFDRRVYLLEESRDAYTTKGHCTSCSSFEPSALAGVHEGAGRAVTRLTMLARVASRGAAGNVHCGGSALTGGTFWEARRFALGRFR